MLIKKQTDTKDLKGLGADGSKISYSLYCDGSAFKWTTTYVECEREGEEIPGGGKMTS